MTTTWTDESATGLASALASHARLTDYNLDVEWRREINGEHNELRNGTGIAPGVRAGTEAWSKLGGYRTWWLFIRTELGITLAEAAEAIGVHPASVSRWERGERDPTGDEADAYRTWLTDRRDELLEEYRTRIFELCAARDNWPHMPTGTELEAIRHEFLRIGGWLDQWRRTGTLPNTNRWMNVAEIR